MNFSRPLSVVTPTLDGDVLSVLASAEIALTGRGLALRIAASQEGVRATLDRLVRQGIVLRERAGNAHLFRLNRQHLAAPWIEELATLRLKLIERLRRATTDWAIRPSIAVVFGSLARGQAEEGSDLDLLIVRPAGIRPEDPGWRRQLGDLEASATAWTGNDTRILEYGHQQLRRQRRVPPVVASAMGDGIVLTGSWKDLELGKREGVQ